MDYYPQIGDILEYTSTGDRDVVRTGTVFGFTRDYEITIQDHKSGKFHSGPAFFLIIHKFTHVTPTAPAYSPAFQPSPTRKASNPPPIPTTDPFIHEEVHTPPSTLYGYTPQAQYSPPPTKQQTKTFKHTVTLDQVQRAGISLDLYQKYDSRNRSFTRDPFYKKVKEVMQRIPLSRKPPVQGRKPTLEEYQQAMFELCKNSIDFCEEFDQLREATWRY